VIVRRHSVIVGEDLYREIYLNIESGSTNMRKKNVMDWLSAMLSMVFYIGLFGGIGYLIQVLVL
jgi:hypothetical protein